MWAKYIVEMWDFSHNVDKSAGLPAVMYLLSKSISIHDHVFRFIHIIEFTCELEI
jgi:hypothetical protein